MSVASEDHRVRSRVISLDPALHESRVPADVVGDAHDV
jgi:hypothetical protein